MLRQDKFVVQIRGKFTKMSTKHSGLFCLHGTVAKLFKCNFSSLGLLPCNGLTANTFTIFPLYSKAQNFARNVLSQNQMPLSKAVFKDIGIIKKKSQPRMLYK